MRGRIVLEDSEPCFIFSKIQLTSVNEQTTQVLGSGVHKKKMKSIFKLCFKLMLLKLNLSLQIGTYASVNASIL